MQVLGPSSSTGPPILAGMCPILPLHWVAGAQGGQAVGAGSRTIILTGPCHATCTLTPKAKPTRAKAQVVFLGQVIRCFLVWLRCFIFLAFLPGQSPNYLYPGLSLSSLPPVFLRACPRKQDESKAFTLLFLKSHKTAVRLFKRTFLILPPLGGH